MSGRTWMLGWLACVSTFWGGFLYGKDRGRQAEREESGKDTDPPDCPVKPETLWTVIESQQREILELKAVLQSAYQELQKRRQPA